MKLPRLRLLLPVTLLVAAIVALCFAPLLVANGVRGWLWWAGRQENLSVTIGSVEAPLLRPVVIRGLRIVSDNSALPAVEIEIAWAQFGLDLAALLGRGDSRRIRALSVDGARITLRQSDPSATKGALANWAPLNRIFADSFQLTHVDFRLENRGTIIEARDLALSASELETGTFTVAECAVASSWISQRFIKLRGATSWQNERLTLGAVTLARGIDLDAITADLSHLALRRIGLEVRVDVFGGKMRANVTTESRERGRLWDIAGTGTDISIAQMSQTLAWHAPALGAIRACKFTFRGNAGDLAQSTASVWAEVRDLKWADRQAETVMLGASLYNRRLHLEQLYVKQPDNQLTLSGDTPLTLRADDWLKPDVNIGLSATINDFGEFSRLFGARPGEYEGHVALEGAMGVEDRTRRGSLKATGEVQLNSARFIGGSRATAKLTGTGAGATIEDAAVVYGQTLMNGRGKFDFGDLRQVAARFFPTDRIVDLTAAASGSCVSSLSFAPETGSDDSHANVNEIDVRGGLLSSDWSVSLFDTVGDAPEQRTERTFHLCSPASSSVALRLAGASHP